MHFSIITNTFKVELEGSDPGLFLVAHQLLTRAENELRANEPVLLITSHNKINCIKSLRCFSGIGLKESKELLDTMQDQNLSKRAFIAKLMIHGITEAIANSVADDIIRMDIQRRATAL